MGTWDFIAVLGPTASGKSEVAVALAEELGGEVICADSVQLYQGFEVGAAAPSQEERDRVPHHLFGVVPFEQSFDAASYGALARSAIADIRQRGAVPIVVGGSGLYVRSLIGTRWHQGLPHDPELRMVVQGWPTAVLVDELAARDPKRLQELHVNDRFRLGRALELAMLTGQTAAQLWQQPPELKTRAFCVIINPPRALLHQRITVRAVQMLDQGLIDEVRSLLAAGCSQTAMPMQSIGYRQVLAYLNGELSYEELLPRIVAATRQYAKRQCTWFKSVAADISLTGPEEVRDVLQRISIIQPR